MNELKEQDLRYFTGTENYYLHQVGPLQLYLTDGCKYVAEEAAAYWIFDIILSYQLYPRFRNASFQHWELRKLEAGEGTITADDGNGTTLARQKISYSDFPLCVISFYLVAGVCMLKSEY
jgi:hypothetical protein